MKIKDLLNKIFNNDTKKHIDSLTLYGVSIDDLPKYKDLSKEEKRYVDELINKIDLANLEEYYEEDKLKINKMVYLMDYLFDKYKYISEMYEKVNNNKDSKTLNETRITTLIERKKLELFSKNFYKIKKEFKLMIIGLDKKIFMDEKRILMFFRKELYDNNEDRKRLLKELINQKLINLKTINILEEHLNQIQNGFDNYNESVNEYNKLNDNYEKEKINIYKERYKKVKIIYEGLLHKEINFGIDALLKDEELLIENFANLETEIDIYLKNNINDIKSNINEILKIRITKENALVLQEKVVLYNEIINYSRNLNFKEDEKKEFYLYKYILNCYLQDNKVPISEEEFIIIKDILYKEIECLEEKISDNPHKFDYILRRNIKKYLNEKKNMIKNSDSLVYDILSLELLECLYNIDDNEYINNVVIEALKKYDCYYKNPNEVKNIIVDFGSDDIDLDLGIYMELTNLFSSIKMCNDYIKINSKDIDECDMYACSINKDSDKAPEYKPIKVRFSNNRNSLRDSLDKITIFYSYRKYLVYVEIPDSVTSISASAFKGCESLTSINIPKGVTWENCAFFACAAVTNFNILNSVTSIDDYAFYCCTSLKSINIPDSVTSIGDYAFFGCKSLRKIYCTKEQIPLLKDAGLNKNVQIIIKDESKDKDLLDESSKTKIIKKVI